MYNGKINEKKLDQLENARFKFLKLLDGCDNLSMNNLLRRIASLYEHLSTELEVQNDHNLASQFRQKAIDIYLDIAVSSYQNTDYDNNTFKAFSKMQSYQPKNYRMTLDFRDVSETLTFLPNMPVLTERDPSLQQDAQYQLLKKARAKMKSEDFSENTISLLIAALPQGKYRSVVAHHLAYCYFRQSRFAKALSIYDKYVNNQNTLPMAAIILKAQSLQSLGKQKQAIEVYVNYLKNDPENEQILLWLSRGYLASEQYMLAYQTLRPLLLSGKHSAALFINLSNAYEALYAKSTKEFVLQQGLTLSSSDSVLQASMASFYLQNRQLATNWSFPAIDPSKISPELASSIAMAAYIAGDINTAEKYTRLSLERRFHRDMLYNLALVYYAQNNLKNAKTLYKRYLDLGGTPGLLNETI